MYIPCNIISMSIMTRALYTSQYRSRSNETSTCKYYPTEKTNQHSGCIENPVG